MQRIEGFIERDELIATLAKRGIRVTKSMLLRWVDRWLLPPPRRKGKGRTEGGSRVYYPVAALPLAGFIALALRSKRDLDSAGWDAWCFEFPVTRFARGYLLFVAEAQVDASKRLAKLLRSGTKAADGLKRRIIREIGPLSPLLRDLSGEALLTALSGFVDVELGEWRSEPGDDPRIEAMSNGLHFAISDWLQGANSSESIQLLNPVVEHLESNGILARHVVESAEEASAKQSLPKLIDWLEDVPDGDLERWRSQATEFVRRCVLLTGDDQRVGLSVAGFLLYVRIRALSRDSAPLVNDGIDAVLQAEATSGGPTMLTAADQKPALWERRADLGRAMISRKRLYLDTKFWNIFCDVQLEGRGSAADVEALAEIRRLVKDNKLVCPGEYTVLHEFLHQKVARKRTVACELVDELSGGAMLLSKPERVFMEVLRFMSAVLRGPPWLPAPVEEMWTKPAFIFGHDAPPMEGIPPAVRIWVERNAQSELWEKSFAEIVSVLAAFPDAADRGRPVVEEMNAMKQTVRERYASRQALYLDQIAGSLDVEDALRNVSLYQFQAAGHDASTVTSAQSADAAAHYRSLLVAGFAKHDLSRQLPTVHILAELYTRADWDLKGKFKPNDLADFSHAASALPYAHCFATERSLQNQIAQTKLDATFGTVVVSNTPALLKWLASIT